MDTRVALIGIIVENMDSTPELNKLLHEYGSYIIGRMGLPYRERNVHIISVASMRRRMLSMHFPGKRQT